MPAPKKATDEQILSALIEHGTVHKAAKALKITPSAIYHRLDAGDLEGQWKRKQYRKLDGELRQVLEGVPDAVRTLRELAEESGPRDSVRMAAANQILSLAMKMLEKSGQGDDTDKSWDSPPDFKPKLVSND